MTIVRPSICKMPDGMYLAAVQVDAMGSGTRNRASRCETPEAAYDFIARSLEALMTATEKPLVEVDETSYSEVDAAMTALRALGVHACGETKR